MAHFQYLTIEGYIFWSWRAVLRDLLELTWYADLFESRIKAFWVVNGTSRPGVSYTGSYSNDTAYFWVCYPS